MKKEPEESIKYKEAESIVNQKGSKSRGDNKAKQTSAKSDDLRYPNADEIYE